MSSGRSVMFPTTKGTFNSLGTARLINYNTDSHHAKSFLHHHLELLCNRFLTLTLRATPNNLSPRFKCFRRKEKSKYVTMHQRRILHEIRAKQS